MSDPGSLSPAFLQVSQTTEHGIHGITLPINDILNPTAPYASLLASNWEDSNALVKDSLEALLTELAKRYPSTMSYDTVQVFTQASPSVAPVSIASGTVAIVGTNVASGWDKATEETLTFRDTLSRLAKLTLLDVQSANNFDRNTDPSALGITSLVSIFTDSANIWRSRTGHKPDVFLARTITLNEKLRRSYRMV